MAFVMLLGIAICVRDRIAVVTLSEEGAEIRSGGVVERHAWGNIASIHRVHQARPPVYRVDFRDEGPSVYCVVPGFYLTFEFLGVHEVEDLSGFGEYAQTQILRASIAAEEARMMTEQRG